MADGTLRRMSLPGDLVAMIDVVSESFHYPENDNWNLQGDEKEQLVEMSDNLQKLWPFVRLLQFFSPSLRDILHGFLWEVDGKAVGTCICQRMGSSSGWLIGNVGVVPAFRRQGIARALVEATIQLIQERGGERIILDVVAGNVPAQHLYETLGFTAYTGSVRYEMTLPDRVDVMPLPSGYTQSTLSPFNWRPRYLLAAAITPAIVSHYEPVTDDRYRLPAVTRVLIPILNYAQGTSRKATIICEDGSSQAVAIGYCTFPTRDKGVCGLDIHLHPDHAILAPYLTSFLLARLIEQSPHRRLECATPTWMRSVSEAFTAAGLRHLYDFTRMGMHLSLSSPGRSSGVDKGS